MCEPSFICTLIDNHSILHVVPCIGYDRHNSVGSMRILPKIVFIVFLSLNQRLLRKQQSVDLVIHTVGVIMIRCSHCLLGHLTLIHVTRWLIVLREWLHCCNHTQHVDWVQLLMRRITSDIFFLAGNRHVHLFQGPNPFGTSYLQVPHWPDESGNCWSEEYPWEEFVLVTFIFARTLLIFFRITTFWCWIIIHLECRRKKSYLKCLRYRFMKLIRIILLNL